jgi:hypothetical protein
MQADTPAPKRHSLATIGLFSMVAAILPALVALAQSGGGTGTPPGPLCLPCGLLAAAMFLWPPAFLTLWAMFHVSAEAWKTNRQYRTWKRTLTPQQRMAANAAELAALMAVQHEVHKHLNTPEAKARRQAVIDSIMHGSS